NLYDDRSQTGGGVLSDSNLHPPPTGNGNQFAGLSHIVFCYGQGASPTSGGGTPPPNTPPSTPPTTTTSTTSPTTTTTSPTTSVKSTTTTKKKKKHHKKKHHVKAKSISRPPKV